MTPRIGMKSCLGAAGSALHATVLGFLIWTTAAGQTGDCNHNGVQDSIDVSTGQSKDCNGNLYPDECEMDCNSNGFPDTCDVSSGTSPDVNHDGLPDECEGEPTYLFDFEESSAGFGSPGGPAQLELRSRLHVLNLAPGIPGTQGWSLFAVATGCRPISATTAGTVAASVTDDPPGLVKDGYLHIRLVPRSELERIGVGGDAGFTSAVVLSFVEPVWLDAAGSPYKVARATLEGIVPEVGCAECLVEYVNWRNHGLGAGGSGGLPFDNTVTYWGATQYTLLESRSVRFCGTQFHRGDANGDGQNDVSDAIAIFSFLFLGGPAPACREAANTDDSPAIDISDGIFLLAFLFLGVVIPPAPGAPSRAPCGPDPGGPAGNLGCERYDGCA